MLILCVNFTCAHSPRIDPPHNEKSNFEANSAAHHQLQNVPLSLQFGNVNYLPSGYGLIGCDIHDLNLHATVWCNLVLSNWDLQSGITRNYNNDLVPSCVWSFSDTVTCWGAQKWSKMTPPTLTTQVAANVQPCQLPSCAQVLLQKSFRIDTNHWLNKIPSINRNI